VAKEFLYTLQIPCKILKARVLVIIIIMSIESTGASTSFFTFCFVFALFLILFGLSFDVYVLL